MLKSLIINGLYKIEPFMYKCGPYVVRRYPIFAVGFQTT